VVMSPDGTGKLAHVPGLQMAGKTGSAQFETHGETKVHAWMISFAPFAEPRIAIAMVVDEGVSGGSTIAPRIKKVMSGIFPQAAETGDGASG
jgi:cell division protein FtsI/penicillin-binding protein 2